MNYSFPSRDRLSRLSGPQVDEGREAMTRSTALIVLLASCGGSVGGVPPDFTQTFGGKLDLPNIGLFTGSADGELTVVAKAGHVHLLLTSSDGSLKLVGRALAPVHLSSNTDIKAEDDDCFLVDFQQVGFSIKLHGCAEDETVHVEVSMGIESIATDFHAVVPIDPYFATAPKSP